MAVRRLLLFEVLVSGLSTIVMSSSLPERMPINFYYQYFDNFTLSPRQYACSKEEQQCLLANTLLYERDNKCYRVGEQGPCQHGERFHVDKREATRLGGHLRGTCAPECEDPAKSPLAATGECLTREEVESQICRSSWYLRATWNAMDEWVCEWTRLPCAPTPIFASSMGIFPVEYNGICTAPDFARYPIENTTIPEDRPSDHPLLYYFTDQSYREQEYPCTEDEAKCLKYGRVRSESSGKCCSPTSAVWPGCCEPGQTFHLISQEVSRSALRGTCKSPCRIGRQPIAGTGLCGDYSYLMKICRWEWGMMQSTNVFGQMVCECSPTTYTPLPPPVVTPPAANPGYCKVPDFNNPVKPPMYDVTLTLGFRVQCSEEEYACLHEGKVLVNGACHDLRTRGPCAPGELLLLDKEALANWPWLLRARCVPQTCEEGYVYLSVDGSCMEVEEVVRVLCENQKIAWDEFGNWQCDTVGEPPSNLTTVVRYDTNGGECELPPKWSPVVYFGQTGPSASGPSASGPSASGPSANGSGYGKR